MLALDRVQGAGPEQLRALCTHVVWHCCRYFRLETENRSAPEANVVIRLERKYIGIFAFWRKRWD